MLARGEEVSRDKREEDARKVDIGNVDIGRPTQPPSNLHMQQRTREKEGALVASSCGVSGGVSCGVSARGQTL